MKKIFEWVKTKLNIRFVVRRLMGWKPCVGYDISNGICLTLYGMSHKTKGLWIYKEVWKKL